MSTADAGRTPDFADALAARLHPYPFTFSRLAESQRKTDDTRKETARKIREEFQKETAALQKENSELRKDKERLDLVERTRGLLDNHGEDRWQFIYLTGRRMDSHSFNGRTAREAIDAAQQSSTPQTGNGGEA